MNVDFNVKGDKITGSFKQGERKYRKQCTITAGGGWHTTKWQTAIGNYMSHSVSNRKAHWVDMRAGKLHGQHIKHICFTPG